MLVFGPINTDVVIFIPGTAAGFAIGFRRQIFPFLGAFGARAVFVIRIGRTGITEPRMPCPPTGNARPLGQMGCIRRTRNTSAAIRASDTIPVGTSPIRGRRLGTVCAVGAFGTITATVWLISLSRTLFKAGWPHAVIGITIFGFYIYRSGIIARIAFTGVSFKFSLRTGQRTPIGQSTSCHPFTATGIAIRLMCIGSQYSWIITRIRPGFGVKFVFRPSF